MYYIFLRVREVNWLLLMTLLLTNSRIFYADFVRGVHRPRRLLTGFEAGIMPDEQTHLNRQ